jgi:hypothetical protein
MRFDGTAVVVGRLARELVTFSRDYAGRESKLAQLHHGLDMTYVKRRPGVARI